MGKTNLHELCFGATGVNPHYGTPVNPLDPTRIPGGSSSGSAVAVATGQADVAFGTDTAGSIRNPAACCGVAGLKTTHGRIPLEGLWPLAPSMDTVGPLAQQRGGRDLGMVLLEPGFAPAPSRTGRWSSVDFGGSSRPPHRRSAGHRARGGRVRGGAVSLPGWAQRRSRWAHPHVRRGARRQRARWSRGRDRMGEDVTARFEVAAEITDDELAAVVAWQEEWRAELAVVFAHVDCIALPSYPSFPAHLDALDRRRTPQRWPSASRVCPR